MKYGLFLFTVVPHKYRAFSHHLEVGPLPSEFILSSIPGPFMRADDDIGCSREFLYLFKSKVVRLNRVVFQVQDGGAYPLGLSDPPNAIGLYVVPFFWGFILCVELKIGVDIVIAS